MKFLLILILSITYLNAYSCTCITYPEEIDSADVVSGKAEFFLGKILKVEYQINNGKPRNIYTVKVVSKYKLQTDSTTIKVSSSALKSACGYIFSVGKTYLISLNSKIGEDNLRFTSVCLRNVLRKDAKEELELIERILENGS